MQSLDIDGWMRADMPFENGVADVTGCSQVGVVPFYDCDLLWDKFAIVCHVLYIIV
jgi:hypothetical protein